MKLVFGVTLFYLICYTNPKPLLQNLEIILGHSFTHLAATMGLEFCVFVCIFANCDLCCESVFLLALSISIKIATTVAQNC